MRFDLLLNIMNSPCNLTGDKPRRLGCIFSCGVQQDELSQQHEALGQSQPLTGPVVGEGKQREKYEWREGGEVETNCIFGH